MEGSTQQLFCYSLAYVLPKSTFPVERGTAADLALLRIANLVLQRRQTGFNDSVLFVLMGGVDHKLVEKCLLGYGLADVKIDFIQNDSEPEMMFDDIDEINSMVGQSVSEWVTNKHPGAIPMLNPAPFDGEYLWWAGIECKDPGDDLHRFMGDFAEILPETHAKRAVTWFSWVEAMLKINGQSLDTDVGTQYAAIYAATIGEWLHGFEAASGNGYNHFDASEAIVALGVDAFFLGHEFAKHTESYDWEEHLDAVDGDFSALPSQALEMMTAEYRSSLHGVLTQGFRGKPCLFWALHSSIWPDFSEPATILCNRLLNSEDLEDMAEQDTAWRFVDDGWVDEADE